jgi:hypothetical protein
MLCACFQCGRCTADHTVDHDDANHATGHDDRSHDDARDDYASDDIPGGNDESGDADNSGTDHGHNRLRR